MVRPGKNPVAQMAPLSEVVAKPMSDAPPPKMRPAWKALTIVVPVENALTSTSVACWLPGLVKGSRLIGLTETEGGGTMVVGCVGWGFDPPPQVATHINSPMRTAVCRILILNGFQVSSVVPPNSSVIVNHRVCEVGLTRKLS